MPMILWDTNIWDFYNTTYPHLQIEQFVEPVSSGSGSASLNSLPSFGFYSTLVSFVLIVGVLLF